MGKTVIHFKQDLYTQALKKEKKVFDIVEEIKTRAEKALAKDVESLTDLLENPRGYVVNQFYDLYSTSAAPHIDRERFILSNITVDLAAIDDLAKQYVQLIKELAGNAPRVTSKGIKSSINKESFNVYLNESMRNQWEAYQRFVEAARELQKYGASGSVHLARYAPDLHMNNLDVAVNWYPYREVVKPKINAS